VHRQWRAAEAATNGYMLNRTGLLGGDLLSVVHHVLAPEHLALWLNDAAEPASTGVPDSGARPDQVLDERL